MSLDQLSTQPSSLSHMLLPVLEPLHFVNRQFADAISAVERYLQACRNGDWGGVRDEAEQIVAQAFSSLGAVVPSSEQNLRRQSLRLASQHVARISLRDSTRIIPAETPATMSRATSVRHAAPLRLDHWRDVVRSLLLPARTAKSWRWPS